MHSMMLLVLISLLLSATVVLGQNPSFNTILADSTRSFSTLVNAFAIANIDISNDVTFPITLFAPNNAAFDKMDPSLLEKLLSAGWDAHLLTLLAMHLLPEVRNFASFADGQVVTAVNDEAITVSVTTTPRRLTLSSPNTVAAPVVLPRTASSDGILYELNDVLLPAFVGRNILRVASAPRFSMFYELLVFSGLDELFAQDDIVATVFIPTNAAFTALGTTALDYYRSNRTATAFLLSGHVIPDLVVSTRSLELLGGPMEYTSGVGETLSLVATRTGDTNYTFTVDAAKIVSANRLAVDGIVHGINRVLAVAAAAVPTVPTPRVPTAPTPTVRIPTAPRPTAPTPPVRVPTAPIPTAPTPIARVPTAPIPTAPTPTVRVPTAPRPTAPTPRIPTAPRPIAPTPTKTPKGMTGGMGNDQGMQMTGTMGMGKIRK